MKKDDLLISKVVVMIIMGLTLCNYSDAQTYAQHFVDGQLFVKFHDSFDPRIAVAADNSVSMEDAAFFSEIFDEHKVIGISRPFDIKDDIKLLRTFLLTFKDHSSLDRIISGLEKMPEIEYAEKIPIHYIQYVPNDSLYHLVNGPFKWRWHLDKIKAAEAWDVTKGSLEIKIAVVDNAVWANHPDLASQVVLQWDATNNTANSNPPPTGNAIEWSHGTHCAGLASAATNNLIGIAAIGFNTRIIAVKTSTTGNTLTHSMQGVAFAIGNEADVINMSFAGVMYSQTFQNLINTGHNMGVVFVASAGTGNGTPVYPAGYDHVIAVGSTNEDDTKSNFSAFGTFIDVMAPGGYADPGPGGLMSTTYASTSFGYYDFFPGTSGSTALVSGLAGLMKSINPLIAPADLLAVLQATCTNIDALNPGYEGLLGAGRINAFEAVKVVPFSPQAAFKTQVTTILPGQAIDFTDLSTGIPASWNWSFEGGTPSSSQEQQPAGILYATAGIFPVTLTVQNAYGTQTLVKPAYITVTANPAPFIQFEASATTTCIYEPISIGDLTLYEPQTWNWDFQPSDFIFVNGTSAFSQHPEVLFTAPGSYDAIVTATNANGSTTSVFDDFFLVNGTGLFSVFGFESGSSGPLVLSSNSKACVRVNRRAKYMGSYGLHFTGSGTPSGWSGSATGTTPEQAWEDNTDFHGFAEICNVDATAVNGVFLGFFLKQTYSYGPAYSWFRVLINDTTQVADVNGNLNFNPAGNSDSFVRRIFNLSEFAGTAFSVTLQSSCRVYDKIFAEGDNVFVDNVTIYDPTPFGDANCDNIVNVLDVVTIASFTMGMGVQPFCFERADVNGDEFISILDLIGTVNIIFGF